MKKIIISLSLLIFCYSCYKDKGNYDYKETNGLKIKKIIFKGDNGDETYKLNETKDSLKITPEIIYSNKNNNDKYKYKWVLKWTNKEEEIISRKKNLVFYVKDVRILSKSCDAYFVVKNETTGISTTKYFQIEFIKNLKKGFVILHESEIGNKYLDLTFINSNESFDKFLSVEKKIYKRVTFRNDLLQEGKSKAIMRRFNSEIVIATNNYSNDYGAILNASTLEYKYPVKNCFQNRNLPDGLNFIRDKNGNNPADNDKVVFFIIDKQVYINMNVLDHELKDLHFRLGFPFIEDEKNIDNCYFFTSDRADDLSTFGNDLSIYHSTKGELYIDKFPINTFLNAKQNKNDFLMKGQCLFIFSEPESGDDGGGDDGGDDDDDGDSDDGGDGSVPIVCHLIVKNNTGVKDYKLTMGSVKSSSGGDDLTFIIEDNSFPDGGIITENTLFFVNHGQDERFVFFTNKNKVYKYNYDAPEQYPEIYHEFPSNFEITYITESMVNEMIVCTYDKSKQKKGGSVYTLSRGKIIDKKENICGKIRSLTTTKNEELYN
jgi:hypothetical protein